MTLIRGPYVTFCCGECRRWIERSISARKAAQDLSDLCDGPQLYCAVCEPSTRSDGWTADGSWAPGG